MEIKKTINVPATTRYVLDKTICDLCREAIRPAEGYNVEEIEIFYKTGSNFPEGGSGEILKIDLCLVCFEDKLIPWLRSQGVTREVENWDW